MNGSTATATNLATGDTSAFSNAFAAQAVSLGFSLASYTYNSTDGTATIDVHRSGNSNVAVSVGYATSNGTAVVGQDYNAASGTLTFPVGDDDETFTVQLLPNPNRSTTFSTVNLSLGEPIGGATLGAISSATLIIMNINGSPSKTFVVTTTDDPANERKSARCGGPLLRLTKTARLE